MSYSQKVYLFLMRVSLGWIMLYAGLAKLLNPAWSASGYIANAKSFPGFYNWLLSPEILPFINLINEWGLTLLGISLILGAGIKYSAVLGSILMALYYFVVLSFPYAGANAFIIDEHIIYILVMLYLREEKAGKVWGLGNWIE